MRQVRSRSQRSPAALKHQTLIAEAATATEAAGVDCEDTVEALEQFTGLVKELRTSLATLESAVAHEDADPIKHAFLATGNETFVTDEAGKVIEVQALGFQRGGQPRPRTAHFELQIANEVAVADLAGEGVVVPDVVVALEPAIQRIGRRRRNGNAEQRIEVGEVLATERKLQIEHA